MCGFLLVATTTPDRPLPQDCAELDRLRDVLTHRGPDAGASWIDEAGTIALLHRRLKVIDLHGGVQPMATDDGRFRLIYNGEIYNYRELRDELQSAGYGFHTNADTEVLLAAFATWGTDCLARLNGMFAFAVFDRETRRLVLARDPIGIKPLYFGWWDGLFYAASEAKAIVADPRVPRRIDPESLDLYFRYGNVPAPWSIWRGMRKLEAAHWIEIDLAGGWHGMPEPRRYWDIPFGPAGDPHADESETLERLDATLRTAVERQTVSDVPLGAFLSGGVDSSLVVSYLAELSTQPVRTFSVGYDHAEFDERPYARKLAEEYATEHHELVLGAESLETLDSLAESYDEPFADPAALPTAAVSRLAREQVTVVLSGDGGDETHAGYPRYLDAHRLRWLDRVPAAVRRTAFGPLARAAPSWKRRGVFEQAIRDDLERYDAKMTEVPWAHRRALYSDAMLELLDGLDGANVGNAARWRRDLLDRVPEGADAINRFQYLDLTSYLPEQLLVKMDRASMRVSLEARVPLLDVDAVRFAMQLPSQLRVRDGRPKYLLRRLLARRMGDEFANRKKHGFRVPEVSWFRQIPRERLERHLLCERIEDWLDRDRLVAFLFDSERGFEFLWPFLTFSSWHRCYGGTL